MWPWLRRDAKRSQRRRIFVYLGTDKGSWWSKLSSGIQVMQGLGSLLIRSGILCALKERPGPISFTLVL